MEKIELYRIDARFGTETEMPFVTDDILNPEVRILRVVCPNPPPSPYTEDGNTIYFKDGVLHCEDGPAVIGADWNPVSYFFLHGVQMSEEDYQKMVHDMPATLEVLLERLGKPIGRVEPEAPPARKPRKPRAPRIVVSK